MCTYGIGLPFDHPIWRNLPPCRCGYENDTFYLPNETAPRVERFPSKCPDCGTWFQNEHRCTAPWKYNTTTSVDTTWRSDYVLWNLHPNT